MKWIAENKGLPVFGIFCYLLNGDRKYEGIMNTKNDPLPKEPHDPVLIEVKATLGRQVTAAWSTVEINGNQFDQQLIRSEYFMLVENNPRPKIFLRSEIFYAHSN